jgi:serine/threonine protein kinase
MTIAPQPQPQPRSGSVFGRYVLVEPIGSGAMGEVWVAIDPDLDRKIALKLLRRTRASREDNPRLIREARAMARLNHPNVVAVHDVGEVEGRVFIAMEFVAGESLAEFVARGPHPWSDVLPLLRQAGAGLAAAHAAGIVHRDLKPANVLIGSEGRVRVLDFGLAATQSVTPDRKDATVGTPAYMAPEQHRGESFDARSDQFAFCVTAFESLYGRRPFPGEHRYAVALAIVEGRLDDVPVDQQAPAWIHRTVLRGLARESAARFPDMLALLEQLSRDPVQRRRRWMFAGSAMAVIAAGVGAWLLRPPPPDPCAEAGDAMAATWSEDRRAALGQWLKGGPAEPWREQASQRLLEGIDTRAIEWMASDRTICTDRVAKRATDRLVAARELCLAQQQQAIDMLVGLADRQDPEHDGIRDEVLARPYALLRAIGRAESCIEQVSFADGAPDPEQAFALARARVWLAIELPERAQQELVEFPCPNEKGESSCDPELTLVHARALVQRDQGESAIAMLEQVAARSLHDEPDRAVQAWLELARLMGPTSEWLGYAEALADDRLTRPTRIELALVAARLELGRDRGEDARLRLDAALQLAGQDSPLDPDLEARLLHARAQAHRATGRPEAAQADDAKAHAQLELALGVGHPALVDR